MAALLSAIPSLSGAAGEEEGLRSGINVIPLPQKMEVGEGSFTITNQTEILFEPAGSEMEEIAFFLADRICRPSGYGIVPRPLKEDAREQSIILSATGDTDDLGAEGYRLFVTAKGVRLVAATPAGIFHGVQTIRQLLPPDIERRKKAFRNNWPIPCVTIEDRPRFAWRGMMLDCCRHFMSIEYVKRTIDLLAYHKMNIFHWHLTEDQGWRIEIKKYPELTRIGAWRAQEGDTPYGGFYTQDNIREVVEYARSRHVTVIPEIEMPGHCLAALASYPEYSCTGGPFAVANTWGVKKDVYCAGNDATFLFLENVLTEVIDLFPAPYVHIGGDECPKTRWEACPKCRERIRAEGLKDNQELQSWFIRRIEKFLISKGRSLIGWDEILEGGLAPEATVQSWRGVDGAIAAAKSGHNAIVSPTSHAYFDYDVGTTDLRKVYSFDPVPKTLIKPVKRFILGGECNMWTEHTPQEKVDSMVYPRLLAMCEVLWTGPGAEDFAAFHDRVRRHYARLAILGVRYGPESRPISIVPSLNDSADGFEIVLHSGEPDLAIRYTCDGSLPCHDAALYEKPFLLDATTVVRARAFRKGEPYGEAAEQQVIAHAALGKKVTLAHPFSTKYPAGRDQALCDGLIGSSNFRDGFWQAFAGDDLEAVIDLGKVQPVNAVRIRFLQNVNSWIFLPERVEIALSEDGGEFSVVAELGHRISQQSPDAVIQEFGTSVGGKEARFVRVTAKNIGICPDWHAGAGGKAWIFADEITVR